MPLAANNQIWKEYPLHKVLQGVFFMCRHHQLWAMTLMAFGAGVLVGTWVEGGFFCHFIGIIALISGYCLLRKNK